MTHTLIKYILLILRRSGGFSYKYVVPKSILKILTLATDNIFDTLTFVVTYWKKVEVQPSKVK